MKIKNTESVVSKVMNVISYLRSENPGQRLSINKVAKLAGVNRSNLYECHPSLIEKIKGTNQQKPAKLLKHNQTSITQYKEMIDQLTKRNRALTFICMEQRFKIESLQKDIKRLNQRKIRK